MTDVTTTTDLELVGAEPASARPDTLTVTHSPPRPLKSRHAADKRASAPARYRRLDSRKKWFPDLRELVRSWDLLVLLSKREITVTYRQTVLGAAWVFISPLLSAGLFTFVFGSVAKLKTGGTPYFAFSYAGLLVWNLFSNTMTGSSSSLVGNSALISKIYFSRLILPLSQLTSVLIQLAISICLMLVMLVAYGLGFSMHLLLLPVWLILAIALAMGAGLILGAISVSYRDVNNVAPAVMSLFLYLTPVAYATQDVPHSLRTIFLVNPVATLVEGCRWSILGHGYLSGWLVVYSVAFTVALLVTGLVVFARLERGFADVI
jgi:lipopolysaccharide transport system permease protein